MNSQGGDRFVLRNFGLLGETERQSASDDFIECSRPETLKMFGQDILCYYGTKSFVAVYPGTDEYSARSHTQVLQCSFCITSH